MRSAIMPAALGATLLLAAAMPAAGQRLELNLLGGRLTDEAGIEQSGVTLAPALTTAGAAGWLRLSAQATRFAEGGHLGAARFEGYAAFARSGLAELGAGGHATALSASSGFRSAAGELTPRLQLRSATWGLGVGAASSGARRSVPAELPVLPIGGRGDREADATAAHGAFAEAWTARGPLSLRASGRAMQGETLAWHEAVAQAGVRVGALDVGLTAGRRSGDLDEQWLGAGAELRLGDRASVVAHAGRYPSDPLSGQAGGRSVTLGLRLATGAAMRAAQPRPARVRLVLRAEPGARVELLGEWNDWRPEPVADVGGGVYVAVRTLPPGTHRFVFRVDGQVRLPDGHATEPDAFGGHSAVVQVHGRS